MYDTAFNKIERELRNEEDVANELDYVEQTSWVLFLKYLHDDLLERRRQTDVGARVHMCNYDLTLWCKNFSRMIFMIGTST